MLGFAVGALGAMKRYAETLMGDSGQLLRPNGKPVLNEATGAYVPAPPTKLYEGKGRLRTRDVNGSAVDIGDQRVTTVGLLLNLPLTVTDVRPGDQWKVVTSADPRLVGLTLTVAAVRSSSSAVQRELLIIDNQG